MKATFEFMNYENQDRTARGNEKTGRGWAKQTGEKFTSCYYDYTKIHNFSETMRGALTWDESVNERNNRDKQDMDEERDFKTENRDQYRTFAAPSRFEDFQEKDEVEVNEASPSPDERQQIQQEYLNEQINPDQGNKSVKKQVTYGDKQTDA
jgi:hypothetical protein